MDVGGQRHVPAALPLEKKTWYPLYRAGWAPVPVWMGVENLAPTVIRSPDHPAIIKLLCLKNLNHVI